MRGRCLQPAVMFVLASVAIVHAVGAVAAAAPKSCCVRTVEVRSSCCKGKQAAQVESPRAGCCAEGALARSDTAVRASSDPMPVAPFVVLPVFETIAMPALSHGRAAWPSWIDRPPRPWSPIETVVIVS